MLNEIQQEVAGAVIQEAFRVTREIFAEHNISDQFLQGTVLRSLQSAATWAKIRES